MFSFGIDFVEFC